jgi:hypothetical protein
MIPQRAARCQGCRIGETVVGDAPASERVVVGFSVCFGECERRERHLTKNENKLYRYQELWLAFILSHE